MSTLMEYTVEFIFFGAGCVLCAVAVGIAAIVYKDILGK